MPSPKTPQPSAADPTPAANLDPNRVAAETEAEAEAETETASRADVAVIAAEPASVEVVGPSAWSAEAKAGFTRPWMGRWADQAAGPRTAVDACRAAGVGIHEYLTARREDPWFERVCRIHDEVVDLCIMDTLRLGAMGGDVRAVSLYFHRGRSIVFPDSSSDRRDDEIPAEKAEAMILALLRADGAMPGPGPGPSPLPPSSRPAAPRIRKSRAKPKPTTAVE